MTRRPRPGIGAGGSASGPAGGGTGAVRRVAGFAAAVLVLALAACGPSGQERSGARPPSDGAKASAPDRAAAPTTDAARPTPDGPTAGDTGPGRVPPSAIPPIRPAPDGRPKVVLIGDSMADEVRPELVAGAAGRKLDLTVIAKGKAGPCNQLDQALAALAARPKVLVVQWIGNTLFTLPCTGSVEPEEVLAEYRAALGRLAAARRTGTTILLVGIPPVAVKPWIGSRSALEPLYRAWPAGHPGFAYVDTTPSVAPAGTFVRTLPCTEQDRAEQACGRWGAVADRVVVRDPVGLHFCPVRYDNDGADCPTPNPGGRRYATAILQRVAELTAR